MRHSRLQRSRSRPSSPSRGIPVMAIIHRIGTPENDSEARAIKRFAKDLPDDCMVFHNFELTTGRGLPYEYDIAVLTTHALYHVEVKGYHGEIRGNPMQWIFENGGVFPSPIPLANKKTKILAGKLRQHSHRLESVFVETLILLTEDRARAKLNDDQAGRVVRARDALDRLCDPSACPSAPATSRRSPTWCARRCSPRARRRRFSGSACTTSSTNWTRTTASPCSWPDTAASTHSP